MLNLTNKVMFSKKETALCLLLFTVATTPFLMVLSRNIATPILGLTILAAIGYFFLGISDRFVPHRH